MTSEKYKEMGKKGLLKVERPRQQREEWNQRNRSCKDSTCPDRKSCGLQVEKLTKMERRKER